jgi:hypothetical protein
MNFSLNSLTAPENMPYVLPAAIVLATGLIVALLMLGRKTTKRLKPPKSGKKSSQWSLQTGQSLADRRASVRREGATVEVTVSSEAFKGGTTSGYVLDRSTGGLRLAMATGAAPGSTMQVRARHAPDTTPWVTVIVRSCRSNGEHFEIGCEFEKTPPWNILLLFG